MKMEQITVLQRSGTEHFGLATVEAIQAALETGLLYAEHCKKAGTFPEGHALPVCAQACATIHRVIEDMQARTLKDRCEQLLQKWYLNVHAADGIKAVAVDTDDLLYFEELLQGCRRLNDARQT